MSLITNKNWNESKDEWGGIDKLILPCVVALNSLGITTVGSCAGHPDSNGFLPYIDVSADTSDNGDMEEEQAIKETSLLHKRVEMILSDFYESRDVPTRAKIVTTSVDTLFSIHNGSDLWDKWREQVNKAVLLIQQGQKPSRQALTQEQITSNTINHQLLISEFNDFTIYLEGLLKK